MAGPFRPATGKWPIELGTCLEGDLGVRYEHVVSSIHLFRHRDVTAVSHELAGTLAIVVG